MMLRARRECPALASPSCHWEHGKWISLSLVLSALVAPLVLSLPAFAHAATSQAPAQIVEYGIPTPRSEPTGITAGPEGNVWFTEAQTNKIGRLTPAGQITEFSIPTTDSEPVGITAGPNQSLWFTERKGNKIGEISQSGKITEFQLPANNEQPTSITAGPAEGVSFTAPGFGAVFTMDSQGEICSLSPREYGSLPHGIAPGPYGSFWYTDPGLNAVHEVIPDPKCSGPGGGKALPGPRSEPGGIAAGSEDRIWYTEERVNKIAYTTIDGEFFEFPIPTPASKPTGITEGQNGEMWFTEERGNKIGEISSSGSIAEFSIPTAESEPTGITAGPSKSIWFTETAADKIGRIGVVNTLFRIGVENLRAAAKGRRVTLTGVDCEGPSPVSICTGTIRLSIQVRRRTKPWLARTIVFARGSYGLPAGNAETIELRLTRLGAALLRRYRRMRVHLDATVSGGIGAHTTILLLRRA